jgi:hypothetical protein
MKLSTIWSLPSMTTPERLRRTRDWAAMELAAILPVRLKYYVTLQQIGKATMDSPNVPATKLEDILRKLEMPKGID